MSIVLMFKEWGAARGSRDRCGGRRSQAIIAYLGKQNKKTLGELKNLSPPPSTTTIKIIIRPSTTSVLLFFIKMLFPVELFLRGKEK